MRNLQVNGERLWASLMELAQIGSTEKGGVCRLAASDLDGQGRRLFIRWCKEAGCSVRVDRIGNIFARRPGHDPGLAPVMTGSHLDTQPTGGKFDGAYGVMAALEVVRTLNDVGYETQAPIEIVAWTNEEGSRFSPAMVGSGAFAGVFDLSKALARPDNVTGVTLGAELERIGFAGSDRVGGRPVKAYFEAHIEQGPILEAAGLPIGVDAVKAGTLITLLEDFEPPPLPVNIVYLGGARQPLKTRAFIDFAVPELTARLAADLR